MDTVKRRFGGDVDETAQKKRSRQKSTSSSRQRKRQRPSVLPDYLEHDLPLVIVGINPGVASATRRRYYAGPGNHFWPLMHESGLVSESLTYMDDEHCLKHGFGMTNLCSRTTVSSSQLSPEELRVGARLLDVKLLRFRPKVVAFNGKRIFLAFSGLKDVTYGVVPAKVLKGTSVAAELQKCVTFFVMPSTSARVATHQKKDKLTFFVQLKELVDADKITHPSSTNHIFPVEKIPF